MAKKVGIPPKQGLYDPAHEHEACGIGLIVNIKGAKSNEIVRQGLDSLCRLDHRGARGAEENTGDGAGVLMQMPHKFLQGVCKDVGFDLPDPGSYGVGMVFFSNSEGQELLNKSQEKVEEIVEEEGQTVLGWRRVPTDNSTMGPTSKASEPSIWQLFVGRGSDIKEEMVFERKLYVIRKRLANTIRYGELDPNFYVASLSCRTIVFKGMLTPAQVREFYPDLRDFRMETAIILFHSRFSTNTFPSWERAHPYRYLIHNGEINALRGNQNWMRTRQAMLASELFGEDLPKLLPI
ncbi:MAG: glutamate synthase subunit alpha, partial [Nitrososphaerales archaeon]